MKPRIAIQIRVSRAEKQRIVRRAKLVNMTVSSWLRMLALSEAKKI